VDEIGSYGAAGGQAAELIDRVLRTGERVEIDERRSESCLERVRAEPLDVLLDSEVVEMFGPARSDDVSVLGLRWTGT
jgi:hypothetical protein